MIWYFIVALVAFGLGVFCGAKFFSKTTQVPVEVEKIVYVEKESKPKKTTKSKELPKTN